MAEPQRIPRILQVGKYYPPDRGGIESHLQLLSEELRKWAEVRILVARNSWEMTPQNARPDVLRLRPAITLAGAPICPSMVAKIARSCADLVHLHLPNPGAMLAYLASGRRGRLVASWHSDVVRQKALMNVFAPIQSLFLSLCDAIVIANREHLDSSDQLDRWGDRCKVIPYGIRAGDFDSADQKMVRRIRDLLGPRIVMTAGRLVYYKGFEHLIRAMTEVDATLVIVGDGPDYSNLEALAWEMGVRSRVVFVGRVEDVKPYYHAANVFVLPSVARSEAFGIVQLEAMACRTPVINTSLATAVPKVSLDGVTGFTVPPGDHKTLALAINRLLSDKELHARFAEAARARVESEFNASSMSESMIDLYAGLLSNGSRLPLFAPRPTREFSLSN
jgi:glycosyltransferase involved in cell wall biosynthesis